MCIRDRHSAAIGAGGCGPLKLVAVLLQRVEGHLGLAGAVHVQDANGGVLHAAGLGGDDAVDRVLDHALDAVGTGGAGGGGDEHLLTVGRGDHTAHSGYTDGEGEVHGDGAVHLVGLHHLLHLLVTLVLVVHMDSGDALGLQGADVVHIHTTGGGQDVYKRQCPYRRSRQREMTIWHRK